MPIGQPVTLDIARCRAARGWSQEHFAEVCGVSHRTVRRAEAGGRVSPRIANAIQSALAPWPADVTTPASILVGVREMRIEGTIETESIHVVLAPKGWRVVLSYSAARGAAPTWCLSADGLCREIGSPKEMSFATQADAIVAAVWRLEHYRRVNHPVLCQRRREALTRRAGRMPREDVWDDAFMDALERIHVRQLKAAC